eukprot:gene9693-13046_t
MIIWQSSTLLYRFLVLFIYSSLIISFKSQFSKKSKIQRNTIEISSDPITNDYINKLLSVEERSLGKVAYTAARLGGDLMISGQKEFFSGISGDNIESKIGSRDIVTQVDKDVQNIIKETIIKSFPTHKFLGEEDIAPGIEASTIAASNLSNEPHVWIVDPIDGTTNFAFGMPLSGVIIAYCSYGKVKHGVIYDPFRSEYFSAWENRGAYLNNNKILCCKTEKLRDSVVCTGSPPNLLALDACLRATNMISPKVRTVRMLGSAAIMLSWVAIGRLTAYFEADLNVWDLAAGSLIIREAGGKVTDAWGEEYRLETRNLVASNGLIHEELLQVMKQSEMWIKN